MAFEAARARKLYREAIDALPESDRRAQRPGLMMAAIYRTLLREIREDSAEKVLNHKLSIPPFRKLILALKTFFKYS